MLARLQPATTGLVAVLVGVVGTVALLLRASEEAGSRQAGFESWLFATTLACGALGIALTAEPREPALIALVVAASGVTMLGVGSAFWGLVAGLVVTGALRAGRRSAPETEMPPTAAAQRAST